MTSNTANPQASTAVVVSSKSGGMLSQALGHVVSRTLPYLPPWVGAAALPPAFGSATHAMWGQSPLSAGLACAALGTGTVAMSAVTWFVSGGNNKFRKFRRVQATASVAAGMGWLTTATAAGPFGHPTIDAWLMGGGAFAVSWNIRQIMRNAHDETEQVQEKGGWGKLAEAIGLEKFQLKNVKGNGKGIVTAEVGIPAGKTVDDAQAAAPRLAAAAQVPASGVTVVKDPEDASRGTLTLRVADLLKNGVEFIPPARLGLLPNADIPVGLYANGETVLINPFDADILQHLLVMGVTGAGKSEFARTVLAHLMTRRKLSIWLIDLAKGRQTVGHMAEGLDWFVDQHTGGPSEAKRMVKCLPAVIGARGSALAAEGLDEWSPKSKLNAMVVWIEEAADVADFEALDKLARAARSVGIWLVISLQRATWKNLDTDVRANLQASACFGVDDAGDAAFGLPDRVIESGAVPDWGSSRPGYGFITGMGVPETLWNMELRGSLTKTIKEQIRALVLEGAQHRDPLDDVTAKAAGLAYEQRTHKGTNRLNTAAPVTGVTSQDAPAEDDVADDYDTQESAMAEEINEVYAEVMASIPGDPEPDADYAGVDLFDDCPEPDPDSDMQFEQGDKPSTEDARAILYGEIDGFARGGRLEFEPNDLVPATVKAGRKRPWLQGELKKLTAAGFLTHDSHGRYTIVASPFVPA